MAEDGETPKLDAESPPADDGSARAKIIEYYERHDPTKATLEHVDMLLSKYSLTKIQRKLHTKYGEAIALGSTETAPLVGSPSPTEGRDQKPAQQAQEQPATDGSGPSSLVLAAGTGADAARALRTEREQTAGDEPPRSHMLQGAGGRGWSQAT